MLDLKCKECGQSFKSPSELEEHTGSLHGIGTKAGEAIALGPPNERR